MTVDIVRLLEATASDNVLVEGTSAECLAYVSAE